MNTIETFSEEKIKRYYRIVITVAIYRDGNLSYKSEMIVPTIYQKRSEARNHIKKEIEDRLVHSNFFRSTRLDYDLVRYTEEASCNTYLRYSITDQEPNQD